MQEPIKIWDSNKWPKQAPLIPFRQGNNKFVKNKEDKGVRKQQQALYGLLSPKFLGDHDTFSSLYREGTFHMGDLALLSEGQRNQSVPHAPAVS